MSGADAQSLTAWGPPSGSQVGQREPVSTTYPVSVVVQPQFAERNRLTCVFRPILAIPHSILSGPIYWSYRTGGLGLLGAAAYVLAIVSWFTLLFGRGHVPGARDFTLYYLNWRTRALTYMALFVDSYPPFGEGAYPASISVTPPTGTRDRSSIALRLLLALPHLIVLAFLVIAWFLVTVWAWFVILFTGKYPETVYPFAFGVMRWALRTEAYVLLLVDELPPFTLDV